MTAVMATFAGLPAARSAVQLRREVGMAADGGNGGHVEEPPHFLPTALDEASPLPGSGLAGHRCETGEAGGSGAGERAELGHVVR